MQRIWIGTSGFSYKEWKSIFYPPDLADRRMLEYYATRFNSVEIDSTFYRIPTPKTIDGWRERSPEPFKFVLKAPQQITQRQRLALPSGALDQWNSVVAGLGGRLGLVCYQLGPFFKADPTRFDLFVSALPRGIPFAFEFRHASWFTPETYRLLERAGGTLCIHDADDQTSPMEITSRKVYVRLRRSFYDAAAIDAWRERFRMWAEEKLEVFAYIKHKDNPDAPNIALKFGRP